MEKKAVKYFCIAPPPLLLGYTQASQFWSLVLAVSVLLFFCVYAITRLIKKQSIGRFFIIVLYFEIGLVLFSVYPAHHWSKYIYVYPVVVGYFLFAYLALSQVKIFEFRRKIVSILTILFVAVLLVAFLRANIIGLNKGLTESNITDGVEKARLKGGCGSQAIW